MVETSTDSNFPPETLKWNEILANTSLINIFYFMHQIKDLRFFGFYVSQVILSCLGLSSFEQHIKKSTWSKCVIVF